VARRLVAGVFAQLVSSLALLASGSAPLDVYANDARGRHPSCGRS
jgi:hypothetical protein